MTTNDVVEEVIKPATVAEKSRYASLVPEEDVWTTGRKQNLFFISHGEVPTVWPATAKAGPRHQRRAAACGCRSRVVLMSSTAVRAAGDCAAFRAPFRHILEGLEDFFKGEREQDVFVWLDILAVRAGLPGMGCERCLRTASVPRVQQNADGALVAGHWLHTLGSTRCQ